MSDTFTFKDACQMWPKITIAGMKRVHGFFNDFEAHMQRGTLKSEAKKLHAEMSRYK